MTPITAAAARLVRWPRTAAVVSDLSASHTSVLPLLLLILPVLLLLPLLLLIPLLIPLLMILLFLLLPLLI